MNKDSSLIEQKSENIDIEDLLGQKQKLESLIKKKFTREITVMFTDLSGSTRLSAELGDLAMRSMIKDHNNLIFPILEAYRGILVKTMGDGTMSYFDSAKDAARAAGEIQLKFSEYNRTNDPPLLIRCGLNTGMGIVEKNDVFGDVVNVAQRFETLAKPMEVLMAGETYDVVKDLDDLYVIYVNKTKLKGKAGPQNIYKLVWDPDEVELYKSTPAESKDGKRNSTITGSVSTQIHVKTRETDSSESRNLPLARLMVQKGDEQPIYYTLGKDDVVVGRSSKAKISLAEGYVSRKHLKIFSKGHKYYAEDLKSNIGTLFRGQKLSIKELDNKDELVIGGIKLVFEKISDARKPSKESDTNENIADTMALNLDGAALQLLVEEKGKIISHYTLGEKPVLIGRTEGCDIKLPGRTISRQHIKIFKIGDSLRLEDLQSNNGTFVNGSRVTEAEVKPGDEIVIGHFLLRLADYKSLSDEAEEKPERFGQKMLAFLSKRK